MENDPTGPAAEGMPRNTQPCRSYKAAFERLEAPISNLLLISKTQRALIDGILPDCEPRQISADQNEAIAHVASLIRSAADELDSLWLEFHNAEGAPDEASAPKAASAASVPLMGEVR